MTLNTIMKRIIITAILVASVTSIFAQTQETWEEGAGEIQNVEIEIVKERQITLPQATRNFEKVPPRPAETITPAFQYDLKNISFRSPGFNPAVKPLKLKQEELGKIYGNMVSAGFGNYLSPYGEAYLNSKRNKDYFYGAHFYHRSFGRGPVDGKNSGSGNTQVDAFGKFFSRHVTTGASVKYENRTTHFYGYPAALEPERGDIRQSFQMVSLEGSVENAKRGDFNYALDAGFNYLKDRYEAKESELSLSWKNDYKIDELSGLDIRLDYFIMAREDNLIDAKPRHLLRVNPAYEFIPIEGLDLSIGLNTVYENDKIGDESIHVYPDIEVDYALAESAHVYAHLDGDIERVSLHTLVDENLWLAPNIEVAHTNRSAQITSGIRGKVLKKLAFNAGFSFASLKNLYFYQNSVADQSKFVIAYDGGDTKRLNVFADAGLTFSEKARLNLRGDLFNYNTDEVAEAWHRPTFRFTASTYVNLYSKLSLNASLITLGGMKAFNPATGNTVDIDAAVDLSTQLNYFWSNRFSIFLQMNNMLAQDYPLYLNYPSRKFQGLVGFNWSF